LAWSYATAADVYFSSPAIGSDGRVYVGSTDNLIYSLTSAGGLAWSYATAADVYSSSPAIGSDGRVYVGSGDARLYALTSAGGLAWSYAAWARHRILSPAIGSDGRVYVGSTDSNLYSFMQQPTATPTATPTITPTATPTYCHEPMIITSGGGDANIPAPAATATDGWIITFMGASDDGVFSSIYDSENIATPGEGLGPQPLKITIQQDGEAINIPAGYPVEYRDGDTWRRAYLPAIAP
ncbi:MAG TPA: PQQ-binding-like beta-propeller repeat protein, partial [bacterium]|nr:PQQ-binding-like beta-propeller repeat protein [bacterium]